MPPDTHIKDITIFDPRSLSQLAEAHFSHAITCVACRAELAPLDRRLAAAYAFGDQPEDIRKTATAMLIDASPGDGLFEDATEKLIEYYLHLKFPKKK